MIHIEFMSLSGGHGCWSCFWGLALFTRVVTGSLRSESRPYWWKMTIGSIREEELEEDGAVTKFQTACTALAATIGTGNIVGVATALTAGGPGAIAIRN